MKAGQLLGAKGKILVNEHLQQPPACLYDLEVIRNDGGSLDMNSFRGNWILLVNTASDCGYTAQLAALQQLSEAYSGCLAVIGFPANDFREQEKNDDSTIAAFCQKNYGVKFPLSRKTQVIRGANQHPVYQWLSDQRLNGWCNQSPEWNFSKYLVNTDGVLTHYFPPAISPLDPALTALLPDILTNK